MVPNWLRTMTLARLRALLAGSGAVILLVGLGSGILIWRAQDRLEREIAAAQAANPGAPLPALDSRKYVRDVEIYYGKAGLLMEEAKELFHGKPLANTIVVVSVLTAAGLFLLATRLRD